jgi:protein required for attachment to host cells
MNKTLIVVADGGHCRIFSMGRVDEPMEELADIVHTEGRMHKRDLTEDRAGRIFRGKGREHHPIDPRIDLRTEERIEFAREINAEVGKLFAGGEYKGLWISAPPAFLGVLRDSLDESLSAKLTASLDKHLLQLDEAEIRQYVSG